MAATIIDASVRQVMNGSGSVTQSLRLVLDLTAAADWNNLVGSGNLGGAATNSVGTGSMAEVNNFLNGKNAGT